VGTALVVASELDLTTGGAAGTPTGLMLKSVPMAALLASPSQTPTLSNPHHSNVVLNATLENAVKAVASCAAEFASNVKEFAAPARAAVIATG
jgi:hypothetical protein